MDDNSEGLLNVPTECPECGEKLELDVTDEFKNLEDDNEDDEN